MRTKSFRNTCMLLISHLSKIYLNDQFGNYRFRQVSQTVASNIDGWLVDFEFNTAAGGGASEMREVHGVGLTTG